MLSEARLVDTHLHVWNHGEPPTITDWEGELRWERIEAVLEEKLADKEYAAIIRKYYEPVFIPGGAESKLVEEIGLYYRAFTDPHRGRIIVGGASPEDVSNHLRNAQMRCAQKVFTANELYALKPVWAEFDTYTVVRDYLDGFDYYDFDHRRADAEIRLEVKRLVYENEWMLGTVWFDGKPVMVISYDGKDGENKDKWITDADLYSKMITWLHTFEEKTEITGFVSPDAILPNMTEFGGRTIHDFYDVENEVERKK